MRTILFLLFVLTLSVVSCSPSDKPETREQALSKGFKLIDQGKYDEAIQYFSELDEKDPHYHVKLALASVYAARAGVKIENIYSFTLAKHQPSMQLKIPNLKFNQQASSLIESFQILAAHWDHVPDVSAQGRDDLQSALRVLAVNKEPGVRLYAAALRIVLLKSSIAATQIRWQALSENKKTLCAEDIRPYWNWGLKVIESLQSLAMDLELAFPKQADEFSQYRAQIQSVQQQIVQVSVPGGDQCF